MKITVHFLGNIREVAGTREHTFDITQPTVAALVDRLAREYGDDFRRILVNTSTGKVSSSVVVALNGVDIEALEGLRTTLKEGDTIAIFPPVAGGSNAS